VRRTGSYCDGHAHAGRSRNAALLLLGLPLVLLLAGCGSDQSTLQPASKASSDIATIWWVMLVGSAVVFAVVLALVVVVVVRRRGTATPADAPGGRNNRGAHIFVGVAGVLVPLIVLAALFALTLGTVSTTSSAAGASSSVMTIRVTGRQWFWDVEYPDHHIRTANEIHIPVDETVTIVALSGDVIHSFWVPELNRKIDTLPGSTSAIELYADKVGRYRGQCAEFCGLQHAHMALWVYADPPGEFRSWLARQERPVTTTPLPSQAAAGRAEFLNGACATCHAIRGTSASSDVGPDLTHLADRSTIGALTLPNDRESLRGWIEASQRYKPGNQMPDFPQLRGARLDALVAYLEGLK